MLVVADFRNGFVAIGSSRRIRIMSPIMVNEL